MPPILSEKLPDLLCDISYTIIGELCIGEVLAISSCDELKAR